MSVQWRELSSAEQDRIIAEVKSLMGTENWLSWDAMASRYGLSSYVGLRGRCDDAYAERRRQGHYHEKGARSRPRMRPRRDYKHFEETYGPPSHHLVAGGPPREHIAARLAEIPNDTRSPAQRLCGDPIPGDDRRMRYG